MKLKDIADSYQFISEDEEIEERENGTYVAVKFSKDSKKALSKSLKSMNIPNQHPSDKFHCTIMYSSNPLHEWERDNKEPTKIDPPEHFTITGFDIFQTQDGNNALVIRGECEYLSEHHKMLVDEHDANYAHEEYLPHVTVSYDCGDIDVSSLDIQQLPEYLEIVEEYTQPVNINWV